MTGRPPGMPRRRLRPFNTSSRKREVEKPADPNAATCSRKKSSGSSGCKGSLGKRKWGSSICPYSGRPPGGDPAFKVVAAREDGTDVAAQPTLEVVSRG